MASFPRDKTSAGAWLDRVIAVLFVGTLGWVVWHLGGVMGISMAPGLTAAMVGVALVWLRWLVLEPTGLPRGWWWPLPMLAYAAWHAASLSATPGRAVMEALLGAWGVAGYWIALHVVRLKEPRRWVLLGVGGLTLLLAGAAFYQRVVDPAWLPMGRLQSNQFMERSSGLFGAPNNLAGWMLVIIPPAWWLVARHLRKRPGTALAAAVAAAAATAALVLTLSRGGWLSLVLMLMLWAALGMRWGWKQRALAAIAVVAVAAGIVVLAYRGLPQVADRVDTMVQFRGERTRPMMWEAAWKLWRDAPWLGTGGGSYEALLERHRPMEFRDAPKWAHNDYLNTLSDYGVVGFALSWGMAAVACGGVAWSRRRRRGERGEGWKTAVGVGLAGLLFATFVDFHFHIPAVAWLAGLAVAEWLVGRRRGEAPPRRERSGGALVWAAWAGVSVAALGLAAWAGPRHRADELLFRGRELNDALAIDGPARPTAAAVEPFLAMFREATRLAPEQEKGWAELSMALALQAHWQPERKVEIGREAEAAARRALALSDEEAMNWVRLGVALDLQGEWAQGGLAFGKAVKLAPTNARVWFYQAFHFSHKRPTHALARSALATCLRLDGRIRQAKALQAALERSR